MASIRGVWDAIKRKAAPLARDLTDQESDELLAKARAKLPIPVFWLLGKTQSGKTSIVRALTRSQRAEIGDGFRPCTRTSSIYSFPDETSCFLRFLDTRGLGEVNYDPSEDLKQFQNQAHLLLVVVKALDHAQAGIIETLRTIHRQQPHWPILVVQTCLHEGYPLGYQHIQPYPYHLLNQANQLPANAPQDLVRSLLAQRSLFDGLNAKFVAIDFTMTGDGFEPEEYGLEQLWDAIEAVLPLGLQAMMLEERAEERDHKVAQAKKVVMSYAAMAGGAAGIPIPYVDIPAVVGIQIKMCREVAKIYGRDMNARRLAEIAGGLGIAWLGRFGVRELAKVIPGVGSAVAGVYSAASTYALGRTLIAYFGMLDQGATPDPAKFRELYDKQFAEGRELLKSYLQGRPSSDREVKS